MQSVLDIVESLELSSGEYMLICNILQFVHTGIHRDPPLTQDDVRRAMEIVDRLHESITLEEYNRVSEALGVAYRKLGSVQEYWARFLWIDDRIVTPFLEGTRIAEVSPPLNLEDDPDLPESVRQRIQSVVAEVHDAFPGTRVVEHQGEFSLDIPDPPRPIPRQGDIMVLEEASFSHNGNPSSSG